MSAMDSSSRNAGEMLDRLTLTYNRFSLSLSLPLRDKENLSILIPIVREDPNPASLDLKMEYKPSRYIGFLLYVLSTCSFHTMKL